MRNPTRRDLAADPRLGDCETILSVWADDGGGITEAAGPRTDDTIVVTSGDLAGTAWVIVMVERKVHGSHWWCHCVRKPG